MAAVCINTTCSAEASYGYRQGRYSNGRNSGIPEKPFVVEVPFVSWNHIIQKGFWCMPCCILEEGVHAKMKACYQMPTKEDICKQNSLHGRCGVNFDP